MVINIEKPKEFREKLVPVEFVRHELHPGLNLDLRREKTVSNSLSYGMALNETDL
jgi:hypothetical protein